MPGSPHPSASRKRSGSPHPKALGESEAFARRSSDSSDPLSLMILTRSPGSTRPVLVASPTELHPDTDLASEDERRGAQWLQRNSGSNGSRKHEEDEYEDIPDLISLAPAIFVPATFDYTKPQAAEGVAEHEGGPGAVRRAHQAAHATAVKANISWLLRRKARRIHRDAIDQELSAQLHIRQYQKYQQTNPEGGQTAGDPAPPAPPPDPLRSRRLSPTRTEDNLMLRNLYASPTVIPAAAPEHQQQQTPTTTTTTTTTAAAAATAFTSSATAPSFASTTTAAGAQPQQQQARTGAGIPSQFSWRDVPVQLVDPRDTPREAATTRLLELVRAGEREMEIYEAHAEAVMGRRIEAIARERAEERVREAAVRIAREETSAGGGDVGGSGVDGVDEMDLD